jgi:hypothetical protein
VHPSRMLHAASHLPHAVQRTACRMRMRPWVPAISGVHRTSEVVVLPASVSAHGAQCLERAAGHQPAHRTTPRRTLCCGTPSAVPSSSITPLLNQQRLCPCWDHCIGAATDNGKSTQQARHAFGSRLMHALHQLASGRTGEDLSCEQRAAVGGAVRVPRAPRVPHAWWEMERNVVAAARGGSCPAAALRQHLNEKDIVAAPITHGLQGTAVNNRQRPINE